MKTRWMTLILVLSLAVNAGFLSVIGYGFYDGKAPENTGDSTGKQTHFFQVLELTQAQLSAMEPLADTFHQNLGQLYADMEIKKESMIRLLKSHDGSKADIEAARRDMADIQDRVQQTVIGHVLDVKKILEPNQQKRFFDLLQKNMQGRPDMFKTCGGK